MQKIKTRSHKVVIVISYCSEKQHKSFYNNSNKIQCRYIIVSLYKDKKKL